MRRSSTALVAVSASLCALSACQRSRVAGTESPAGLAPLPVAAATSATSASAPPPPAPPVCDPGNVLVFVSPERPVRGQPMRVVAVTDREVDAQLAVTPDDPKADAGATTAWTTHDRAPGPPYSWLVQVDAPNAGKWRATLTRDAACGGASIATKEAVVARSGAAPPPTPRTALWLTRASWTPAFENLYSAWIEHMFDDPPETQRSWNALHEVLRDRSRNFLFDHLGLAEDEQGVVVRPDCADLPYFLRAYFAYKLGLPFGWSRCRRGENGTPPTCSDFASQSDPFPKPGDAGATVTLPAWADPARDPTGPWETEVKRVGEFFRTTLADAAQSGAGRTPAEDETADYYPVTLSVETLRPGTIFADPYGHVLVVAKRIPQSATSGGVLFAVDGQPDGTVARKRFWRGNFLFAIDPTLGSAGFKRFRPVLRDTTTGKWRHALNREMPDYSGTDQYAGGVEGFYDKADDVLSPAPLDPMQALLETIQALEEQVKTRVNSVDNGRKYLAQGKPAAEMPDGARIFEATGDWEDFSTPSRDLRLLIALDVARGLPARVARRPERYAMPAGKTREQVTSELEARLAAELRARTFEYTRSDGTPWKLTLQDVAARQVALEMAYNPNDCVEQRWAAPEGSDELSTCRAHAPAPQVAKMATYRSWFHERRRPPR